MNLLWKNWIIDNATFLKDHNLAEIKTKLKEVFKDYVYKKEHGKIIFDLLHPENIHPCSKGKFISYSVGYRSCEKKCLCYKESLSSKIKNIKKEYTEQKRTEILEKRINTVQKRYGVTNVFELENVKNKAAQTKLETYGDPYYRNNDKIKETCIKKYNVDNPMKAESIREKYYANFASRDFVSISEKIKKTKLEKYGDLNYRNKQKAKETCLIKYGVDNPSKAEHVKKKISNRLRIRAYNFIPNKYEVTPLFSLDEYVPGKELPWKCDVCNNIIYGSAWNGKFTRCYVCYPKQHSLQETELFDFIKSLGVDAMRHDRSIIAPKELDIIIPKHNLAIEYCGLYWHSDRDKDKNYHKNKLDSCYENGIKLITIFSDEWENKQHIVKSKLSHLLNHTEYKIQARNTKVVELTSYESDLFLSHHHLHGSAFSKYRYGLEIGGELVSVMTFAKSRFGKIGFEMVRFASACNTHVIGGAGKLLAYFRKQFPNEILITYSDNTWGYTNFYKKLGFTEISKGKPSYTYINFNTDSVRYNRIKFQKHKIVDNNHELTEQQIMINKGFNRIYDCGSTKWIMTM